MRTSLPSSSFSTQLCAKKKSRGDTSSSSSSSSNSKPRKKLKKRKKKTNNQSSSSSTSIDDDSSADSSQLSKQELMKQVGESIKAAKRQQSSSASGASASTSETEQTDSTNSLLDRFNPFKAGQELRKTIDTAIISTQPKSKSDSVYYLDDRLAGESISSTSASATTNSDLANAWSQQDYVPEVLVVGALGGVGQSVVQRLLREGPRFRVRVLVPNLFMDTLERFGTGVMYSQGDLQNMESLEFAVTDVDKIIFCPTSMPGASKTTDQKENDPTSSSSTTEHGHSDDQKDPHDDDEAHHQIQQRAEWAEQIDFHGMKNLVQAYQNVRHADYGTNQAAKRTLFKFSRVQDFNLFVIDDDTTTVDTQWSDQQDDEDDDDDEYEYVDYTATSNAEWDESIMGHEDDEWEYVDVYDDDDNSLLEYRDDATITAQVQWIRNKFDHAVFVGRVPTTLAQDGTGAQAAIVSSRLRSRESPDMGIDLASSFAGFILRVCSDGSDYEAFVRTSNYETDGIEYVCPFSTDTKMYQENNRSKNKFITIRLPFEKFQPVLAEDKDEIDLEKIPSFYGQDVQQLGFRYRAANNKASDKTDKRFLSRREQRESQNNLQSFYLAFSYIKLYRSQPEPEFIYVSDAGVPPIVRANMVNHNMKRIVAAEGDDRGAPSTVLLDDNAPLRDTVNTEEEVYYKYVGEETLKKSGLAYAVVRVKEYQEGQDSALTEIVLAADNESASVVTQDQVAQICVSALLDPGALNKSFYARSIKANPDGSSLSSQFESLPKDPVALP